jgi:asparagine N-glycosylation enzyme membrane subunit Stt3
MALFALYGTWSQNVAYFASGAGPSAFGTFVLDAKVNPASRSLGVDIAVTFYAASLFMVIEARKIGVRFVWAYVILGLLVAISVTFPLFLVARELRLAKAPAPEGHAGARDPTTADVAGLAVLAVTTVALCLFVIRPG